MILRNLCKLFLFQLFMMQNVYAQENLMDKTDDQKIQAAFNVDQSIRQKLDSLQKANCSMEQLMPYFQEMANKDANNQKIVLPILDNYLAGRVQLSDESLHDLFYIIQHSDGDIQMKYEKFIKSLFDKKLIANIEYAMFVDRLKVRQNKAQQFGFQCYMNAYTLDKFCYPISANMERQKAEIGLENIEIDESSSDYPIIYVLPSEYVIFGHILQKSGQKEEFKGTGGEVIIGQKKVVTNNIGFYAMKLNKCSVPDTLTFFVEGREYSLPVQKKLDADWEIIDLMIQRNK